MIREFWTNRLTEKEKKEEKNINELSAYLDSDVTLKIVQGHQK